MIVCLIDQTGYLHWSLDTYGCGNLELILVVLCLQDITGLHEEHSAIL